MLGKQNLGSNIQQLGRSIVYLGEDTGPRQVCGQEPPRAEPRPDRTRVMPDPMHPALVLVYHVLREPDRLENAAHRPLHLFLLAILVVYPLDRARPLVDEAVGATDEHQRVRARRRQRLVRKCGVAAPWLGLGLGLGVE